MKVAHWTMGNKSGMHRVAESISLAERALGVNSILINLDNPKEFSKGDDADVHISHTHLPDVYQRMDKGQKIVWVGHGVPEHVFHQAVEKGLMGGYGHGDAWMLCQFWLQNSDAIVTFWPRHAKIYQDLCDRGRKIDVIPMGIDLDFFRPVASAGKYTGAPSVFSAENSHYIKWPLDLFIMWPWIVREIPTATLHAIYVPNDQHRWFFPLVNRNGCSYSAYITGMVFDHTGLRNAFCSTDYYMGLVRYGDHNRVMMEAKACGCKTISYKGNIYSDYWIDEGDQRCSSEQVVAILNGEVEPRVSAPVPSIVDTAKAMLQIYRRITNDNDQVVASVMPHLMETAGTEEEECKGVEAV